MVRVTRIGPPSVVRASDTGIFVNVVGHVHGAVTSTCATLALGSGCPAHAMVVKDAAAIRLNRVDSIKVYGVPSPQDHLSKVGGAYAKL